MKRMAGAMLALLLLCAGDFACAEVADGGEPEDAPLMPVISALGYSLDFDPDHFVLDCNSGDGDVYWWAPTYGDAERTVPYVCVSARGMSAARVLEELRRHAKKGAAETETELAGAVCPVLTCPSGAEGEGAQSTFVCVPVDEDASLLVEMRCLTGDGADVGTCMWQLVETLQVVPAE